MGDGMASRRGLDARAGRILARCCGRPNARRTVRLLLAGVFSLAAFVFVPSGALASPTVGGCQSAESGLLTAGGLRCLGTLAFAGAEAQFRQLNWMSDEETDLVPDSDVGEVEFSFSEADSALLEATSEGHHGGYVNVATNTGSGPVWSVENLYLSYPDLEYMLESHPAVQFNLGVANGTPVDEIQASVVVTGEPLSSPPTEYSGLPVAHEDYHVGGNEGGSGEANTYNEISSYVGCTVPACIAPKKNDLLPKPPAKVIPKVAEDVNGCVPGAISRSLYYMFGEDELKTKTVKTVYEELRTIMAWNKVDGVTDEKVAKGKEEYVEKMKLPVKTTNDLGNFKKGVNAAPAVLIKGGDVELKINWMKDGKRVGGHVVMVTSITEFTNAKRKLEYEIKYIEDPKQGSGTAANVEKTIKTDDNGVITSGLSGTVVGFLVEKPGKEKKAK